jgi:hypothetical protein
MIWTTFMPVLNEGKIIESKILNALSFSKHVVVVEGSIPQTYDVAPNGLSSDETSDILKGFADRITYLPVGRQPDRATLQNKALEYIHTHFPDTEILHRTDADEFLKDQGILAIENEFKNKPLWMLYTDLVNMVDGSQFRPNNAPKGRYFGFCPNTHLTSGMYHERFYRYRPDLLYRGTAHALSDGLGRSLYWHPDYYFNREVFTQYDTSEYFYLRDQPQKLQPLRILHYKYIDGFKRLLKAEMSYLAEDEHMVPMSDACFTAAKTRLKSILDGQLSTISPSEHAKEVVNSKWWKPEPLQYDWNITLDEVLT